MQSPYCNTYRTGALPMREVVASLWEALQEADDHLPDLDQFGSGELAGDHFRVKFVQDPEHTVFGCEVVDLTGCRIWEAGFARVGQEDWRAFWRDATGIQDAPPQWTRATAHLALTPTSTRLEPSFLALCNAVAADAGGVTLAENVGARTVQGEELAYWRELARNQARAIERLQQQRPASAIGVHTKAAPQDAATATQSQRNWALRDLGEWAALNSERIVILPRAVAAARKAVYEDSQTVYAALEVLAGSYRQVKHSQAPRDQAKQELEALGIAMGGSIEPGNAEKAGDGYFIRWQGRRRFLDQHLKKGSSRDPRYCLRVYFTWDDELQLCVVGWLPSHLVTSRT